MQNRIMGVQLQVKLQIWLVFVHSLTLTSCSSAYYLHGLSDSFYVARDPTTLTGGDFITRDLSADQVLNGINQRVVDATDRASPTSVKQRASGVFTNRLSDTALESHASVLRTLENTLTTGDAGKILSDQIDAVVAKTFHKSIPQKVDDVIPTTIFGEIIRRHTDRIALNAFSIGNGMTEKAEDVVFGVGSGNMSRRADSFASRQPGGTFESGFESMRGEMCHTPSTSQRLNLTSVAYDYPQNSINLELRQRPELMLEIFRSRRPNLQEPGNPTQHFGLTSDCFSTKETLEAFQVHGIRCWVVFSRHQNVQFYRCGSTSCGGGGAYRCSSTDTITPVWTWCDTSYGNHRIIKLELPLPVNCNCVPVTC